MINTRQIHWLAGILDGEGCFRSSMTNKAIIILKMTDEDTVIKVRDIMKEKAKITRIDKVNRKTAYLFYIHGNLAVQWMLTLYTLMCKRRQAKIKELIDNWRGHESRIRIGHTFCKRGHSLDMKDGNVTIHHGSITCKACATLSRKESRERSKLALVPTKAVS